VDNSDKKYQPLILPSVIWSKDSLSSRFYGEVEVGPLETGFGATFANSLRRILLGGVEGAAITSIVIDGVNNECSVVKGVSEDVMEMILNCKQVVISSLNGEPGELSINRSVPGDIYAGDLVCSSNLEVINKDLKIATVSEDGNFSAKFFVTCGRGYVPAQWTSGGGLQADGKIYIDSMFTPVTNVTFDVHKTRVGGNIDYDKFLMKIDTNGTITPIDAFNYAVSIAMNQFECFLKSKSDLIEFEGDKGSDSKKSTATEDIIREYMQDRASSGVVDKGMASKSSSDVDLSKEDEFVDTFSYDLMLKPIDSLGLPARVHNCLIGFGVSRVIDLVNSSGEEVVAIKNFGKKSYDDLVQIMKEFGLSFDMNIDEEFVLKTLKENKK
jgi:DNA-directed RNA polymerase subunit alpha